MKRPHDPLDAAGVMLQIGDRVIGTRDHNDALELGTVVATWPGESTCAAIAVDGDHTWTCAAFNWVKATPDRLAQRAALQSARSQLIGVLRGRGFEILVRHDPFLRAAIEVLGGALETLGEATAPKPPGGPGSAG